MYDIDRILHVHSTFLLYVLYTWMHSVTVTLSLTFKTGGCAKTVSQSAASSSLAAHHQLGWWLFKGILDFAKCVWNERLLTDVIPLRNFLVPKVPKQDNQAHRVLYILATQRQVKKIRTGWITFQDCNSWILDGFLSNHNWAKICDYTRAESFVQVLKS